MFPMRRTRMHPRTVSRPRLYLVQARFSFDEDGVPVFTDNILVRLRQETHDVMEDIQKISVRREGRRQCPASAHSGLSPNFAC